MKTLYFYPENPLQLTQGNNARALALLHYFKNRNINLTLVGHESKEYTYKNIEELKAKKIITNGVLLSYFDRKKKPFQYLFKHSLPNKILGKIKAFHRIKPGLKLEFNNILKQNEYDYIIISYAYWTDLIKNNKNLKKAKIIVDTHDYLTAQLQQDKNFKLGKYFQKEIALLNHYDELLVISSEEKFVFSQFINKPIHIIAHGLPEKQQAALKKTDIIYVASDNEHNVKAANWFFEKVLPLLPKSINILVIGKICNQVKDFENVSKIKFIDNLDEAYASSKIAICPMLTGTGLKIKVVEALSFGLPIVCNERGVDGLLNKTNNGCLVTNNEQQFADYILSLLNDEKYYEEKSTEAKTFFNETLSLEAVYKNLDAVFTK